MKSRIIVTSGQTCNKFFSLLKPLHEAWVSNQRQNVMIPDRSLKDYDNLVNNPYLNFPLWNPKLARYIGYSRYEDLINRIYIYGVRKNPLIPSSLKTRIFKESWVGREFKVEGEFLNVVRDIFRPNISIVDSVDKEFSRFNDRIIVGIHIRRGDYKDFRNGKYYFTDGVWVRILNLLVATFDKRIVFFVSTNEKIDWENYNNFDIFTLKDVQGPSADLYGLSKCDYIVGPPSTYSNWAALIGEKPLCHIEDKECPEIRFEIPRQIL